MAKKINENNALSLHSSLTFNNTIVNFSAPADWNLVMSSNGVLNLNAGSKCNFTVSGIYASPNATINVDASSLGFEGTGYTAMMAEKYGNLNLKNGASLSIKHASNGKGGANGITSFKINATGSTLDVSENENQGLVRCWLTLDNSTATVSGNETGMTCYNKTDALTMKNGSKLIMENNKNAGIFMWGGNIDVQDGNTLVVSGTGYGASASDYSPYCGAVVSYYYYNTYTGSITFADGATVNIINNPFGGLRNYATTYLGSGTSIENNGYSGNDIKTPYGGGIWNCGQLTLSPNAKVCNNHALHAGDDIYNTTGTTDENVKGEHAGTYTGSISFNAVGNNWQLDDCNHAITGWFDDSEASGDSDSSNNAGRWNAHSENKHVVEYSGFGKEAVSDQLSLKAAHGLASVKYQWVSTDNPTDVLAPTGDSDLEVGAGYTAKAQDPSEGWTFDGWYTDESCTIKWNDGDALAGSMTLFGKWTQDPKAEPSPAPETSQPGNQPTVTKAAESQQAASPEHLAKTGDALLPFGFAVAGIALIAGAIALISRKLLKR